MSNLNINEDAQSGGSQSSHNEEPQSSGSQQVESSAFPDEDEETITMLDVIEREEKLEDEASAVLGFSDDKNCTYQKGYIARQALYSCATCSDGTNDQAAICLACSLECHESHDVIELYTKRNYRCDCGNSKFKPGFECKLMDKQTKKADLNENNKYNHNFSGRYCICDKPYPPNEGDTSAESNDDMYQCIVCEDWYHSKHLGANELPDKFDELICRQCADKLEFIYYYKDIDKKLSKSTKADETCTHTNTCDKNVNTKTDIPGNQAHDDKADVVVNSPIQAIEESSTIMKAQATCESDTNDSQVENKDPSTSSNKISECFLENLIKEHNTQGESVASDNGEAEIPANAKGPLFWQDCAWRTMLCKCEKCLLMYREKDCEYLIDERDTVEYYEAQGRAMAKSRESPYERGMSALNRMNRAAVVEALHGYDELKADLSGFLRRFADTKKVVREEDIHDFFAQYKTKKRQRLEYD